MKQNRVNIDQWIKAMENYKTWLIDNGPVRPHALGSVPLFNEVCQALKPILMGFARGLVGHEEDLAHSLVNFVLVVKLRKNIHKDSTFATKDTINMLKRWIRNEFLDHLRHEKVRLADSLDRDGSKPASFDMKMQLRETVRKLNNILERAVSRLNEKERLQIISVWEKRFIQWEPIREIALELNCSASRINRDIAWIKNALGRHSNEFAR